jgi:hypothetical protein
VLSYENQTTSTDESESDYTSLYGRAVSVLRHLRQPGIPPWANHFFSYDHLTLVNRDSILAVGGWDTHIPYYATDCDMYDRLLWAGYWQGETPAGVIFDVGETLEDLGAIFRLPGVHARLEGDLESEPTPLDRLLNSSNEDEKYDPEAEARRKAAVETDGETWDRLYEIGNRMQDSKWREEGSWRNSWQTAQTGGKDEPFYRDPQGFETGLEMMIETGRKVFAEKWGHRGCDILRTGRTTDDAWRLEKDWIPKSNKQARELHDNW